MMMNMNQKLNYAMINFGGNIIRGRADDWDYSSAYDIVNVCINGVWYQTGVNNLLLMHKDGIEA